MKQFIQPQKIRADQQPDGMRTALFTTPFDPSDKSTDHITLLLSLCDADCEPESEVHHPPSCFIFIAKGSIAQY